MGFGGRALLVGTLTIAGLHALIPSHWLAFAVVGRAQRWSMRQTLTVAGLAGTGHVAMTTLLGLVLAGCGKALLWRAIPPQLEHGVTGILLIALGCYFALGALRNKSGCGHHHGSHGHVESCGAGHGVDERLNRSGATPTIIGALVLGLTLSPCLDLLSVYVAASALSWAMLLLISIVMAVTTVGIMVFLIWLTLHGLDRLNLGWLERNEGLSVGLILISLGGLLFFVH